MAAAEPCGNTEIKRYSPLTEALEMVLPGAWVSVSNSEKSNESGVIKSQHYFL